MEERRQSTIEYERLSVQLVKKLVNYYVGLYTINEVVFTNAVKLKLPIIMRISKSGQKREVKSQKNIK